MLLTPPVTNCHTFPDPLPPRAWRTLWTAPLLYDTNELFKLFPCHSNSRRVQLLAYCFIVSSCHLYLYMACFEERWQTKTSFGRSNSTLLQLGKQSSDVWQRGCSSPSGQISAIKRQSRTSFDSKSTSSALEGSGQLHCHAWSWSCQGTCNRRAQLPTPTVYLLINPFE